MVNPRLMLFTSSKAGPGCMGWSHEDRVRPGGARHSRSHHRHLCLDARPDAARMAAPITVAASERTPSSRMLPSVIGGPGAEGIFGTGQSLVTVVLFYSSSVDVPQADGMRSRLPFLFCGGDPPASTDAPRVRGLPVAPKTRRKGPLPIRSGLFCRTELNGRQGTAGSRVGR